MTQQDELHLQTLADLESEVRCRYGRAAEAMLAGLPLDYAARLKALRRLAGLDPTAEGGPDA